jgi:DNA (cytosine-5)-methyltransferase 1
MKTHLDLFSGIGGFALAARWSGFETVQFVEIEPYAQKVLAKNFPDVPIHDDIKTFKADEFCGVGLLTGGYPCQPFSLAGERRGKEDDRHLWPEMLRIIREARPDWVLAENVAGHVSMGLDEVLSDLENEGYTTQPLIIPACAKDARHRRDRVWIVARNTKSDTSNQIGQIPEGANTNSRRICEDVANSKYERCLSSEYEERSRYKEGVSQRDGEDVAHSQSKRVQGCGSGGEQESHTHGQEGLSLREGEGPRATEREPQPRLGGTLSDGVSLWMDEPDIPRVGVGIPDRAKRLKAIGNAIVPAVAYEIMRWMR